MDHFYPIKPDEPEINAIAEGRVRIPLEN